MQNRVRVGGTAFTPIEASLMDKVFKDNNVAPGEMTKMFERELAAAHGYKHGICLNSGQSALMVSLIALKKLNDVETFKIAVPATTYISTIAAVVHAGCIPVLTDVTPDARANMIYSQIPDDADVIMPVHLFGRAIDGQPHVNNPIIEDACESAYAPGVGFGAATCLSFYSSHTITAGYGGAILCNDDDFAFQCWKAINHGRIAHDDYTSAANLADRFTFDDFGYSLKFCDLNAAMGLGQHINRDNLIQTRQEIGNIFINELSQIEWLQLPPQEGHTFMMFPMVVREGVDRNYVVKQLNNADIETRMLMPITNQPVIKQYFGDDVEDRYPNAKLLNERGFYVGCHPNMEDEDIERVINTLKDI